MSVAQLFDLRGRKALVTGASRGIGQAIAIALADAGADVAITARDGASLTETSAAITAKGREAVPLALDVRDVERCRAGVAEAAALLGGLDVLVNNAGYEEICPSLDVEEALWDKIVSTNLKGAFFCAQAAARHMQAGGKGGSIINLCSLTSYVGVPTAAPYACCRMGGTRHSRQRHCAGLFPHGDDGCVLRKRGLAGGHAGQDPDASLRRHGRCRRRGHLPGE